MVTRTRVRPRRRSLEALPSVETVLTRPELASARAAHPRVLVLEAVRAELAAARAGLADSGTPPPDAADFARRAAARAAAAARPRLRPVPNPTRLGLPTNL